MGSGQSSPERRFAACHLGVDRVRDEPCAVRIRYQDDMQSILFFQRFQGRRWHSLVNRALQLLPCYLAVQPDQQLLPAFVLLAANIIIYHSGSSKGTGHTMENTFSFSSKMAEYREHKRDKGCVDTSHVALKPAVLQKCHSC